MEIFRWTIKSLPERGFSVTDLGSGPWVLSHVSGLWRAVTLRYSELWSSFTICFSTSTPRSWAQTPDMLNTVLIRSGACELSIHYSYEYCDPNQEGYTLLHALMVHSHRWKHVSLVLAEDMFEDLRSVRGALGSLQSLQIDMDSEGGLLGTIDAFEFAPRLNRVKLIGNLNGRKFILPWSQLITYHEELGVENLQHRVGRKMHVLLKVIRKCTALEDLALPLFSPLRDAHDTSKIPRVSHDSIRHLTANSGTMIPFLTLTSLRTLALDLGADTMPGGILDIRRLIRRSDCSLTVLDLGGTSPGKEISALLRCTPNLARLAFRYKYSQWKNTIDTDFIHLFEDANAFRGRLLPKLQSLTITIGNGNENPSEVQASCLDSEAFVGMIESRWWVHRKEEQLQVFKFIANVVVIPGPSLGTIERLQGFKEEGMHISIRAKMADSGQEITYV